MMVYLAWVWDCMECMTLVGIYDSYQKAEQAAKDWILDCVTKHTELFAKYNMEAPDYQFQYRVNPQSVL